MPDEILTLPEVAQLLKVAEKTVYTMAQKSQLPAFKVRGQWRFKREDIDAWIEQQKQAHAVDSESPGRNA
jgi:excisionase family DNA binding protein